MKKNIEHDRYQQLIGKLDPGNCQQVHQPLKTKDNRPFCADPSTQYRRIKQSQERLMTDERIYVILLEESHTPSPEYLTSRTKMHA